jgi:hypothetical protein
MSTVPRYGLACLSLSLMLSCLYPLASAEQIGVVAMTPRANVHGDASLGRAHQTFSLLHAGPRYGIGGNSPLGEEQKENFQLYDIAAVFQLPWVWQSTAVGWALGTRLITSGGELTAAGTSSLMGTMVPAVALTSPHGIVSLDLGLGAGFFSNHRFGVQDFGGPAQIVGTAGLGVVLFRGFHAGYRFQHFSDAGMYGPTSLGVDMHIMDLSYRF